MSRPRAAVDRHSWLHAVVLCTASGIADAIGYVQSGVFAANMTGNTVLAGLSIAAGNWNTALERALTLATFFGGALLGRVLLRTAHGSSWLALGSEAVMLAGATLFDPHAAATIWLIAAAMGVQSTGMTRFGHVSVNTVVITGTLSRLAESAVDTVVPRRQPHRTGPSVAAPGMLAASWISYGFGALAAAWLLPRTAFTLLLPAALVLLVALLSLRVRRAID